MDFVGRYENLREDVETLCGKLGVDKDILLPHKHNAKIVLIILNSTMMKQLKLFVNSTRMILKFLGINMGKLMLYLSLGSQ